MCKEYIPHKLAGLQAEYERESGGRVGGLAGSDGLLDQVLQLHWTELQCGEQGRQWEQSGDYSRAVDCYLRLDTGQTRDPATLAAAWTKVT